MLFYNKFIKKIVFVSTIFCIYFNFQHVLNFSKNYLPNLLFLMISYIFYNYLAKQRISFLRDLQFFQTLYLCNFYFFNELHLVLIIIQLFAKVSNRSNLRKKPTSNWIVNIVISLQVFSYYFFPTYYLNLVSVLQVII